MEDDYDQVYFHGDLIWGLLFSVSCGDVEKIEAQPAANRFQILNPHLQETQTVEFNLDFEPASVFAPGAEIHISVSNVIDDPDQACSIDSDGNTDCGDGNVYQEKAFFDKTISFLMSLMIIVDLRCKSKKVPLVILCLLFEPCLGTNAMDKASASQSFDANIQQSVSIW